MASFFPASRLDGSPRPVKSAERRAGPSGVGPNARLGVKSEAGFAEASSETLSVTSEYESRQSETESKSREKGYIERLEEQIEVAVEQEPAGNTGF